MRKTLAESLLGKFTRLAKGLEAQGETNPEYLNWIITVLERNTPLDTWVQILDVWEDQKEEGMRDSLQDVMIMANVLWKQVRVHPMFKELKTL